LRISPPTDAQIRVGSQRPEHTEPGADFFVSADRLAIPPHASFCDHSLGQLNTIRCIESDRFFMRTEMNIDARRVSRVPRVVITGVRRLCVEPELDLLQNRQRGPPVLFHLYEIERSPVADPQRIGGLDTPYAIARETADRDDVSDGQRVVPIGV